MTSRRGAVRLAWLPVLLLTALGAGAGYGLYEWQVPTYSSSAQVLIQPRDYSQVIIGQSFAGTDPLRQLVTARVAAQSRSFEQAVANALTDVSPGTVHKDLGVSVVDGANVLQLTATGATAAESKALAQAAATTLTTFYESNILDGLGAASTTATGDQAAKIEQATAFERANPSARVLSEASEPVTSKRPLRTSVVLGGLAGLVIALLVVAWRLRTRVVPVAYSGTPEVAAPAAPAEAAVPAEPVVRGTAAVQAQPAPPATPHARTPAPETEPYPGQPHQQEGAWTDGVRRYDASQGERPDES